MLHLSTVGPGDDFFEMGGNSLIVAAAVTRLNKRLGIDLPLRALFEAPTPAEMAELIDGIRGDQEHAPARETAPLIPDWVVPLQREGTNRPVFVFPAGHGGLRALTHEAQVAALVGRDHPFWGLRREHPQILQARQIGIPAVATAYVRQMRTIQETGPFLLYAACAGGYLAWEAAKQLLAAGQKIAGILFYEVFLRPDFDALLKGLTPAHVTPQWSLSLYYRPQPLPVDLTLLMTEEWHSRRWSEPWRDVARGNLETIVMRDDASGVQDGAGRRQLMLAGYIRDWLATTDARVKGA
jgi:hypothetical protein